MITTVLQFIQIRDPSILVDEAKSKDGTLFVVGSDDGKRRRFEGRDVKRAARAAGYWANYSTRKQGWFIHE